MIEIRKFPENIQRIENESESYRFVGMYGNPYISVVFNPVILAKSRDFIDEVSSFPQHYENQNPLECELKAPENIEKRGGRERERERARRITRAKTSSVLRK